MTDGRTVINIDPNDLKLDKTAQMITACWSADISIHRTLGHELHFETLAVWMDELVAACMAYPGDDIDQSYAS